jgi:PST family polysaccharide transporter
MLKPLQNISQTISQPLFAGLASMRDNKSEARDTYCKMVLAISLITFPIMLGLALVSSEFILTVFGPKWAQSIPILQILSIVGAFQSVGTTVGTIYQSQGRTDIMFRVGILCSVCYCATFIVGAQFGIFGVALSYGIVSTLLWVYTHWVANRLLDLPNKTFWKNLLPPTILSIGMSVPVIIAKLIMLRLGLPVQLSLAIQVITGGVTYLFLIYNSKHPEILSARLLVSSKLTGVFAFFHRKHPKSQRTNAQL